MNDALSYPIGRFAFPTMFTDGERDSWRNDIAELPAHLRDAIATYTDEQLDTPYRDGGWTVRQTVHHIADSHMNAYCRFRLALTEDSPTIKVYEQAAWAELPDARTLPVTPSLQILDGVHTRLVHLLDSLTPEQWQRGFVHPEQKRTILLWQNVALYAWHSKHHVAHITALSARNGWLR